LPELPDYHVVMYFAPSMKKEVINEFAANARAVFGADHSNGC